MHAHPLTTPSHPSSASSTTKEEETNGCWARAYARAGYSVIPACAPGPEGGCRHHGQHCRRPGKVPLVPWARLQEVPPDLDAVRRWWTAWPDANLAVICGQSTAGGWRLIVLDVERKNLGALSLVALPATATLRSQGGGLHFWFCIRQPVRSRTVSVAGRPLGDLRAMGALATVPPSRGPQGLYEWARGLGGAPGPVAAAPAWLLQSDQPAQDHNGRRVRLSSRFVRPLHRPAVLALLSTKLSNLLEFDYGFLDRSALDFRVAIELFKLGVSEAAVQQVLLWPERSKAREKLQSAGERACGDYLQRTLQNAQRRAAASTAPRA